jgi:hypothetical protein
VSEGSVRISPLGPVAKSTANALLPRAHEWPAPPIENRQVTLNVLTQSKEIVWIAGCAIREDVK